MASKETFLSKLGQDLKIGFREVFGWLGSSQGKAAITSAEVAAEVIGGAVNPALAPTIAGVSSLVNAGIASAVNAEALAAAAGQQAGTGTQKAAAVTAVLSSQAGSFLKSVGVSDATDAEVQSLATVIGTASANILNAIPARATGTTNATPAA